MTAPITASSWPEFMEKLEKPTKLALDQLFKDAEFLEYMEDLGSASMVTERMQDIEPMGTMNRWYENTERPQVTIQPGYAHVISQKEFASEVRVTKKMERAKQYDVVADCVAQMQMQPTWTQNVLYANYLALGDVATASVPAVNGIPVIHTDCPDGNPMFDTAHTWRSGGATRSNHTTGTTTISEAALNTINVAIQRWKNNQNLYLDGRMEKLLIPVDLEQITRWTLESKLDPLTGNNRKNIASSFLPGGYKVLRYLESTTEWFVKTNLKGRPILKYLWRPEVGRRGPEVDNASNRAIFIDYCVGDTAPIHADGLYKVG